MSWSKYINKNWDEEIYRLNPKSFHFLETFSALKEKKNWSNLKLIYLKNNNIICACSIFYKKKYFHNIVNISGGIEGGLNQLIFDELAAYLKKLFGLFSIVLIDIYNDNIIDYQSSKWKKLTKKKFSTIIKNLDINNNDLLNSYNKNFRHNVRRGIKLNDKNIIKNKIVVKDVYQEYKNLENMKKITSQYSYKDLMNIVKILKKNIVFFELRNEKNELLSFRAMIYFNELAWDLLAVTSSKGRKIYSSYYLINHIFEYCIKNNIKYFDFSGVDMEKNIGVYNFKQGSGGKIINRIGHLSYSPLFFINLIFRIFYFFKYN